MSQQKAQAMQYWMMKTEPNEFSFEDLVRNGKTHWDGVHNYQARNNMKLMHQGDLVLIYHSVGPKELVGVARVQKEHYPDPTDKTGKWVWVDIEPVQPLVRKITLQEIKDHPTLQNIPLVRQSRLSVMPLSQEEFEGLLQMAKTPLKAELSR